MSLSLGPFDLDTLTDRGPRGSIWRAVHPPTGRVVTIEVAADGESARVLHAVRALARLSHPAVRSIHAYGRVPLDLRPDRPDHRAALSPGAAWCATAPLERRALSTLTTWPAVRDMLGALLDGLAHCHAHRVIHCALSRETVGLTADGPMITDFGGACVDGARLDTPESGCALGPWTDLSAVGRLVVWLLRGGDVDGAIDLARLGRLVAEAPIDAPPPLADWLTRLLTPHAYRFRFAADAARALHALDGDPASPDLTLHEPTALTGHLTRHDEPYASTLTLEAGQLAAAARAVPIPPHCPSPPPPPLFTEVGATLAPLRSGPLIGREAICARLWSELRSAAGGHARLVVLEGPAGSGKGHVAQHVARMAHAHGFAEYVVAKHPLDGQPGSGLGAALADLLCPSAGLGGLSGLDGLDGVDGRLAALTADTLGLTDRPMIERAASCDPRLVDPAAVDACITLLGTLCVARPLIVQIDDAQWAPGALRLARRLLDGHRALPLLMIVCARDEPDPRAAAAHVLVAQLTLHPRVTRLAVPPLDAAETAALITTRVTLPPEHVDALVAGARGVPRRVIDHLHALADGGPAPLPAPRAGGGQRVRGTTNPLPPVEQPPAERPRATPTRPADPLDLAPHLGPYALLGRAGQGGAGEVWKALHRTEHVTLAIKFVTATGNDRNRRHFEHELRAVARMDHPQIIRVHDRGRIPTDIAERCGLTAGAPYIVMDWHDGGTLRSRLGAVDYPALYRLLVVLLDALAHAHARDVIHRDIKPANILLGDDGPVLTDFGVALTLDGADGERGPRGTPGYMAPEQIRSQSHRIGPWTDLYALGCLTHALVTGRAPFGSRPPLTVMQRQLDETPPPLTGDFPPGFDAWVSRLLDKDPARRFRFAAHARAALPPAEPSPADSLDTLDDPPSVDRPRRLSPITHPLIRLRQPEPTGRAAESATLWSALEDAIAGPTTTAVLLEGPSGHGKTALVRWLTRRAHTAGRALPLTARHQRHAGPTDGLSPMLARALRITDLADNAAVAHVRETLGLDRYDPLGRAVVAATRPQWQARDSQDFVALGSRHEHFATLGHALARLCALTPRVLHIDDAQWAPEAIDFVEHLCDHHPDLPLVVIVTVSRDQLDPRGDAADAVHALTARPTTRRLGLSPLPDDALAEMIRRLAPADPALVVEITRRAAGSPLLAELLLERWIDADALVPGPDGLRLRTRPPGLEPAAHALWIARLEEVLPAAGPATWRALELAATLGVVVSRREWSALTAAGAPRLAPSTLAVLCDAGLAHDGATTWSFAHAMLRDALLERARLAGRLTAHHARCARALATLPDVDPQRRARHHHLGGDPAAALPLYLTAATRARRRTDITATRRALYGALRALRNHRDPVLRVEITARWALTDKSRGHLERARRHARRARHLARSRALDSPRAVAWAAYALGEVTLQSDPPGADAQLARAYRAALAAHAPQLAARALEARGWALFHRGHLDAIDPLLDLSPELVDTLDDPIYEGNLIYLRAIVARARGDLTAATRHLARARLLFRIAGTRHGLGSVRNEQGEIAFARGQYQAAYEHYLAFRDTSEALAHRSVITAALNLGRACDALGRPTEGEQHRRDALRLATRDGDPVMSTFARVCLLVDVARDGRFEAFDALIDTLDLLRDGTLVAPEAADATRRAADLCTAAGEHARAARALEIATVQDERLGR